MVLAEMLLLFPVSEIEDSMLLYLSTKASSAKWSTVIICFQKVFNDIMPMLRNDSEDLEDGLFVF